MDASNDNLEKAFYSDGYKLGMIVVEEGLKKDSFNRSVSEMYAQIDSIIDSLFLFARQQGQTISCKLGCEWCCHQPIFALDYELEYLKDYLNKYLDKNTTNKIRTNAQNKQKQLKNLKDVNLLNAKYPCPLLNKGICIAYEARPMACRIYLSSNLNSCTKFFESPYDKTNYPALLDLPMRLGRMMNEGFKAALKTKGVIAKEFRIEEKLL